MAPEPMIEPVDEPNDGPAADDRPVVVVTGASGGVGAACIERFTAGGWRVVGVDLAPTSTAGVHVVADLARPVECRRAIAWALEATGRLDGVVNAAGVWHEGPAESTTDAEWDRVLDLNLKGLFFVSTAAIPHLERTGGWITNLSSDAGVQGNTGAAVYCASKGGVTNLTRALALELAPRGVRVNAVCPGDIDTPMLAGQARDHGGDDPQGYLRTLLGQYPQGPRSRFIRPAEVAELIWFLGQPSSAPITGANLSIDFGLSSGI